MDLRSFNATHKLQIIAYGKPGSGKTVFAHGAPRTRTLDLDDGMGSVAWAIREGIIKKKPEDIVYETFIESRDKRGRVITPRVFDQCTMQFDKWLAEPDWDTLVIDSATELSEAAINKGLVENGRLGLSKSQVQSAKVGFRVMKRQDWGSGMNLFMQFVELTRTYDKHLIYLCHEYATTGADGTVEKVEPLLIGQLRERIPKSFGEVYYVEQSGTRDNKKYTIQTVADPKRVCKSRFGCLPSRMPADFDLVLNTVKDYWATQSTSK